MNNTEGIAEASAVIKDGGIVIFPTDTAFGIGCRIDDRQAVDRVFAIRQRPRTQATPVLVDSMAMALEYFADPPTIVALLMKQYWPGALTIVSRARTDRIYDPVRGGGQTVGVRMPDHPVPLSLIRAAGVPIIGTSANIHGKLTPHSQRDLDPALVKLADFVVTGSVSVGSESTVVDCSVSPVVVLRQGVLSISEEVLRAA